MRGLQGGHQGVLQEGHQGEGVPKRGCSRGGAQEANKRMVFLHKLSRFTMNKQNLRKIYILQIRSKLEQSAVLWHSSITQKCQNNLERVQKSALN